jgi:outer membrane receptor protein involved in Fe transport
MKLRKHIYLLFALLFSSSLVIAGTTGKIAGLITDKETGEPVVGANVYLDGYPFGSSTDTDGYYYILNIPPGKYTVIVQMIGYQQVTINDVAVKVDLTTQLDVELATETVAGQEVVIIADRPLVQKDLTASSKNIGSDEINALPVDDFGEMVELQAGVVAGHFRGGRLGEVAYMIDGIPVNDPYNNGLGLVVENSAIQQLEVISGTFNAEYGQALSGVVNIVSREGGPKQEFDFSAYAGNYLTTHDKIFPGLDKIDGKGVQSLQFSAGGPLPGLSGVKYFASYRNVKEDGHLYGARLYLPSDDDPFLPSGDSSFVPMNNSKYQSFNGRLSYYLTPTIKLSYGFIWNNNENRFYNHSFRLVPDALKTHYRRSSNHSLQFNHTVSQTTFYTLKLAQNYSKYYGYVFADPFDPRYLDTFNGQPASNYTFRSGGYENDRYRRSTTSRIVKWDINSQITKIHKIGAGVNFTEHELNTFGTAISNQQTGNEFEIVYPSKYSVGREEYIKKPYEFSAYIQDKMEYESFIVNAGVRFDYFNPNTKIPVDKRNPNLLPLFNTEQRDAKTESQISPRLGVAFPISTSGVIHVSYGLFFQIPNFEQLYAGIADSAGITRFPVPQESGTLSTIRGNPELKAQRTATYEIGLNQGLTSNLAVEFTAYYRDIRNLTGTEIIETYEAAQYARYVNRDYGNVRGIILAFEKRFSNHWGARMDYTYQIAEGNASDPRSVFFDNQSQPPRESEKQLIPLDWDQRSTFNFSINAGTPGNWNVGLTGRVGSGTPYTASGRFVLANINIRNNRTKPSSILFDLRIDKTFRVKDTNIQTYIWIENLFDRLNEWNVYGSTGQADRDLDALTSAGEIIGLHTLEDFITNPTFYSPPRRIRLGVSFGIR